MDKYKAKPQGNYVVLLILWLLVGGAVAIVLTMLSKYETSALNTVIFMVIPVFFVVPAFMTTYATLSSSLSVEEGKVVCVLVVGLKRYSVEFSLEDVRAVWAYRRTVATGRHMQVASGIAFRRADGATLSLDLTIYTDQQRRDFLSAVCAQGASVEELPFAKDTGKVFRQTMPPAWEGGEGASSAVEEARQAVADTEVGSVLAGEDSAPLDQAEEAPAEAHGRLETAASDRAKTRNDARVYHYRAYEGSGSVRCSLCGARIASAVSPGEHHTGGYLASDGKKWVCRDCWERFAEDYHWVAED